MEKEAFNGENGEVFVGSGGKENGDEILRSKEKESPEVMISKLNEGVKSSVLDENLERIESGKTGHLSNGVIDGVSCGDESSGVRGNFEVGVEEGMRRVEPVVGDGTEVRVVEVNESTCVDSTNNEAERSAAWPEKAAALTCFVKEKGVVAVSRFLRIFSLKKDEAGDLPAAEGRKAAEEHGRPMVMKGRVIAYTRLGCQNCREVRRFLRKKRLRYVEINIDVYPGRKVELEKFAGSSVIPSVFFNDVVIGGLNELQIMDESGELQEKIDYVVSEAPSRQAPLLPLSGEDDPSCSGSIDELALIARKMKDSIAIKDRFYKMRRFMNCFLGSEAVDFLSDDQYLEREEAVEFGRKLASKLFFHHVLEENLFEDSNHLYRFLDDDPVVSSQCYNIPRGIIEAKPKPFSEIASRLRFLSYAILEAYTSEDGKHVDYRSIHGSEEFARYLRTIQELQRVEIHNISREERLAFFINLCNMMAIHAILVMGYPAGASERQKLFGDFKYVIGGCTYSHLEIQNGILRGNQRPPYSLLKPFDVKDNRSKVSLSYPEPLIHFALVCGTRSGPALRWYSPGSIDEELMEAARSFLRDGGIIIDFNAKVAHVSKIFKWFSMDFGKDEVEVLKHASIYLEPTYSEALLVLLADSQLKVIYQPYDWGLNC